MACHQFDAKPWLELMLKNIINWTIKNKIQRNSNDDETLFFTEEN